LNKAESDILKILTLEDAKKLEEEHSPEWVDGFRTGCCFLAEYIRELISPPKKPAE